MIFSRATKSAHAIILASEDAHSPAKRWFWCFISINMKLLPSAHKKIQEFVFHFCYLQQLQIDPIIFFIYDPNNYNAMASCCSIFRASAVFWRNYSHWYNESNTAHNKKVRVQHQVKTLVMDGKTLTLRSSISFSLFIWAIAVKLLLHSFEQAWIWGAKKIMLRILWQVSSHFYHFH